MLQQIARGRKQNMDWKHKALLAAVAVTLLLAAMAIGSYIGAREDRIRMQATLDAQKAVIQQAAQERQRHVQEDAARDTAAQKQLDAMQQLLQRNVQTPQQIARWAPQQVQVPQPINVNIPPATPQNPSPDAVATIPQVDLPAIREAIAGCKECKLKLETAQQDLASQKEQLRLAGEQLSAVERERDAALKAAKGGGFWQRTGRAAKWFLIGAAAGAAAAKAR